MIVLVAGTAAGEEEPLLAVSSGKLDRMSNFPSKFVDARNIDVWLPDGYDRAKRYRVLYMHDGQALFNDRWSVSHQSWRVACASSSRN
jgi:enterochelin esterase-like enzyme